MWLVLPAALVAYGAVLIKTPAEGKQVGRFGAEQDGATRAHECFLELFA